MSSFVHLHCHTEYSLLDGAIRVKELVNKAVEFRMPAVAMTDHGNLHGAVEFFQAAKGQGIKPLIGMEAYVAPRSMSDRSGGAKEAYAHVTLLAANEAGYRNLVKLSSASHLEGFYYKPRVDQELIARHAEGVIALSGCLRGDLNTRILAGDSAGALEQAATWRDIFGQENYFIELHNHGMEAQRKCNPELIEIARQLDLRVVAANDAHFLERSHHESHDILICVGTGAMVLDSKRMRYSEELYFKSPEEMAALFVELPEAISNTLLVAERCELEMEFGRPKYPAFEPPAGKTREEYLRELCQEGLRKRYGERAVNDPKLAERLDYELEVLEKTGFVSYFLIVWDFIHHAKTRGIPVGPGRGSAAGSLIAYVLGITDIDPIRFGLIFERFLNPDRVSPPDIDVDFCMVRRGEVIEYVRQKYGERCVSQIVTFGTMGAKSVVRDVARVMGWSYGDADRLAKMIPSDLGITLSGAAEKNPDLKAAIESDDSTRQLWDHATRLEGLSRNTGIHAAGVVIGDRPLDEYIPLCRGKENEVVTQYEMGALTELGMLKMDFLGLKTLTVIDTAVNLIRQSEPAFDVASIPMDDREAFDIYNRGETVGVFQMESGGLTNVCKRFDVRSIEDIVALGALYRPGPMQFIDDYIARKKGLKTIEYIHPLLEQVCAETYGIIVYQEQVQRAANVLAGYTLGQADLLRRAMGKKDVEKMAKERKRFVEGCEKVNGIPPKVADSIFGFIEKFAQYGFNKSHSAAYGWVSYQTAYLKAHYPIEFMAALLTHDASTTDRLAEVIAECRRMEIPILPPSINESGLEFTPVGTGEGRAIRFGLASIKNVGEGAMRALVEERKRGGKFTGLEDFCARLDSRTVNRKILESLVKCGAFDEFSGSPEHRSQTFAAIESAMSAAAAVQRDRASGQGGLFDDFALVVAKPKAVDGPSVEPWPKREILAQEKELLGFYVSGHPLEAFAGHFDTGKLTSISVAKETQETATLRVGGIVMTTERRYTRKDNRPFGVFVIEDFTGSLEVTAWDDVYTKAMEALQPGEVISAGVRLTRRDDGVRATATSFTVLKPKASVRPVHLRLIYERLTEDLLGRIAGAVRKNPGKRPLVLQIERASGESILLHAGDDFGVAGDDLLRDAAGEALAG
ncbi:MAG: DNA polymerase III subunit alpha [Terrimicrobiaceae bacterium]